jgi:hypothetical protein
MEFDHSRPETNQPLGHPDAVLSTPEQASFVVIGRLPSSTSPLGIAIDDLNFILTYMNMLQMVLVRIENIH